MTSSDFLYTILATCSIILTVFLSLALYHLIVILKRIRETCDIIEERTERFFHLFDDIREKIASYKSTLDMIGATIKAVLLASSRVASKRSKKKKISQEPSSDS
jgi:predicted nucleic acid-binding OB-fold protein